MNPGPADDVARLESFALLTNPNLTVVPVPLRADRASEPARWIQSQMARFSDGVDHVERRVAVDDVLAGIPLVPLLNHTRDETEAHMVELAHGWASGRSIEADGVVAYGNWHESATMVLDAMPYFARRRPVVSLVQFLLPALDVVDPVVDDVAALARALAGGSAHSGPGDDAAERLLDRFGDDPGGIASVSVLFQTIEATAALIGQALAVDEPGCTARDRVSWAITMSAPVSHTLRYALDQPRPTVVALDSVGPYPLTFGAGPHACPGRQLATLLAEAIVGPFVARNWRPRLDSIVFEPQPSLHLPASLVGRLDPDA